jgi:predicted amidohydrolase
MKISILQMDILLGQVDDNIKNANMFLKSLTKASESDFHIVILPEMWTCGYDLPNLNKYVKKTPEIIELLKQCAINLGAYIVPGSLPWHPMGSKKETGIFNTTFMIDPQGEIINEYSKMHLFHLMKEEQYMKPGNSFNQIDIGGEAIISQFICYDLRFPEIFRKMAAQGTNIFIIVAQWPNPRMHHWRSLLIARAIENQAFVIAVNRTGEDRIGSFFGHSMVVNPWGEIVLEATEASDYYTCTISPSEASDLRRKLPFLEDRRLDLYPF